MHINYDDSVDYEEAVEMFLNLHPTKIISLNHIWSNDIEIGTRRLDLIQKI